MELPIKSKRWKQALNTNHTISKEVTKSGEFTLKVNNYYLHSKYKPMLEAEQIAKNYFKPNHYIILFGFGMGYIAKELEKLMGNKANEKLIIVDPIIEEISNLNNSVSHRIYNKEAIERLENIIYELTGDYSTNVIVICSPNYDKIFQNEYAQVLQAVRNVQYRNKIDQNTLNNHALSWQENYIKNQFYLLNDRSLNALENAYDCPVVIASAGPSLSKQLELLKEIEEKVLIIAAGSTITTLLNNGIEPDYVVSIDAGFKNLRHYQDLKFTKTKMIYSLANYYEIRELFPTQCFPFLTLADNKMQQVVKERFDIDLPMIGMGGTCSIFAYSIACFITTGPITFIGQDLAYTNGKSHAIDNKGYWEISEKSIKALNLFYSEGYYDEKVLTSYSFYSMKKSFETIIEHTEHNSPVYNSTEGGLKIQGLIQKSFKEFCNDVLKSDSKKIELFNQSSDQIANKEKCNRIEGIIENELIVMKKIKALLVDGLAILAKNRSNQAFKENVLKKLDLIDKKVSNYFQKTAVEHILQPIILEIMNRYPTQKEENRKVYNQTRELYTKLLEATEKVQDFNNELLQKIKKGEER